MTATVSAGFLSGGYVLAAADACDRANTLFFLAARQADAAFVGVRGTALPAGDGERR